MAIDPGSDPHRGQPVLQAGAGLAAARAAMIMVHGRGASAADILSLAEIFQRNDIIYLAPQAADSTWYPYRFFEPVGRNEPYLSSALPGYRIAQPRQLLAGRPSRGGPGR